MSNTNFKKLSVSNFINKLVPFLVKTGELEFISLMLVGVHGIGKTVIGWIIAQLTGIENENVYEIRLGEQSVSSFLGIPDLHSKDNQLKYKLPDWIVGIERAIASGKPVLIFLDEMSRVFDQNVRQFVFQIVERHRVHGMQLPKGSVVVCSDNDGEFGDVYQTLGYDVATYDRLSCYELEVDPEGWLNTYYVEKPIEGSSIPTTKYYNRFVAAFIAANHIKLHSCLDLANPNAMNEKVTASPRSWERFGRRLNGWLAASNVKNPTDINEIVIDLSGGDLPENMIIEFLQFCKDMIDLNMEDILEDTQVAKDLLQDPQKFFSPIILGFQRLNTELQQNKTAKEKLHKRLNNGEWQKVLEFINKLPAEMAATCAGEFLSFMLSGTISMEEIIKINMAFSDYTKHAV